MTKNVFLQLIGGLTLIGFIAIKHLQLHNGAHIAYESASKVEWQQPSELDERYLQPIGNKIWRVQFTAIEPILRRISTGENNELRINKDTPKILEQACGELGTSVDVSNWQRLRVLLEKGWPKTGKELHDLWQQYCAYQFEYKADLMLMDRAPESEKSLLLEQNLKHNEERQMRFFGDEYAGLMFAEINAQTRYLTNRRLLMLNNELNKQEKRRQLNSLERDYKMLLKTE